MANGWANENAVQEQIDATLDDAIAKARSQLHSGESAEYCVECVSLFLSPAARHSLAYSSVSLAKMPPIKKVPHLVVIIAEGVKIVSYGEYALFLNNTETLPIFIST